MGRSLPWFIPPAPKTHGSKPVMHRSSDEPTPAPVLPLFAFSFFFKNHFCIRPLQNPGMRPVVVPAGESSPSSCSHPMRNEMKPARMLCLPHPEQSKETHLLPAAPPGVSAPRGSFFWCRGVTMPAEPEAAVGSCRLPGPRL